MIPELGWAVEVVDLDTDAYTGREDIEHYGFLIHGGRRRQGWLPAVMAVALCRGDDSALSPPRIRLLVSDSRERSLSGRSSRVDDCLEVEDEDQPVPPQNREFVEDLSGGDLLPLHVAVGVAHSQDDFVALERDAFVFLVLMFRFQFKRCVAQVQDVVRRPVHGGPQSPTTGQRHVPDEGIDRVTGVDEDAVVGGHGSHPSGVGDVVAVADYADVVHPSGRIVAEELTQSLSGC